MTATTAADGAFTASVNTKDFNGILNLVRTFGTTRILSSPRLTEMNDQTAVLKVARNEVYFLTQAQFPTTVTAGGVPVSGTPVFSSTPRTVPVGLVMTVQPSIDAAREKVTMTLRPKISRVVSRANDPSIGLNAASAGISNPVQSQIPVLALRDMDSVLQMHSGEVAVMGALIQDSSENTEEGVPPFDTAPIVGNRAKSRDNNGATSELVILLRATILDNAAPYGADIDLYRRYNNDPRPLPFSSTPHRTEYSMRLYPARQRGFTLVELSIVLVIIGLIIGGALTGREIMQNARITNAVNAVQAYQSQLQTYAQNYSALPGDDAGAVARFPTLSASVGGNGGGNGDGNGMVGNGTSFDAAATTGTEGESRLAWAHLRAAGLVKNQVSAGSTAIHPINPFGGIFGFQNGAFTGSIASTVLCLNKVPGGAAQAIDARIDDGAPDAGNLRSATDTNGVGGAVATGYADRETYTLCFKM